VELNASLILPLNYDPNKKYPVFVNVYGGPGHNEVLDAWDGNDYFFHQLLAQHGYMVLSIDPRGTQFRGAAFKKATYLQLGKLEIEDVLAATKVFAQRTDVDPTRLGIMGWSYGGFMSSLAMTKGNGLFKVGIAVAPVTNWRYYDNIYTERFLRTPQENAKGYDENSPINYVKDLQGKYFLIHGSADDNVHYQNSMEMISALVKANKQFDLFIYPNKNHGIYGGNTRNHLFNMIFDYIKDEL
jgi:dipeptidyl-peptidase-4